MCGAVRCVGAGHFLVIEGCHFNFLARVGEGLKPLIELTFTCQAIVSVIDVLGIGFFEEICRIHGLIGVQVHFLADDFDDVLQFRRLLSLQRRLQKSKGVALIDGQRRLAVD